MSEGSNEEKSGPFEPEFEERTDPRFRDRIGDRLDAMLPETVKKLALAGMGAIFMTEEGIRNAVSDLKLPREAVSSLLAQTEKARADFFRMVAIELRGFLEEANLAGELRKVLVGLSLDVQASISFRSTEDGGVRAEVDSGGAGKRRSSKRQSDNKRSAGGRGKKS